MSAVAPFIKAQIKSCVDAVKGAMPVLKVVVFGSSARGETTKDSDLDLLVVIPDNHGLERPGYEAVRAIGDARTRVPFDVVVITETQANNPSNLFIKDALREGFIV